MERTAAVEEARSRSAFCAKLEDCRVSSSATWHQNASTAVCLWGRIPPASVGVAEELQLRVYGDASLPALIYLPGLHGDWTLITRFRPHVEGKVRFVEITYPRTLDWSLADYGREIVKALNA